MFGYHLILLLQVDMIVSLFADIHLVGVTYGSFVGGLGLGSSGQDYWLLLMLG